jgi:pimeloyl-ACP methyl ester carboxylesterase
MSDRNAAIAAELVGARQILRLAVRWPKLLLEPRGRGRQVMVLPGHGFGDATTTPLRSYLRCLGYQVRGWGLGANREMATHYVPLVAASLEKAKRGEGERIALVGQSLGGYVAREVARQRPDLVEQVITLGSPVYRRTASADIEVPVTALYSRVDQVVPPRHALAFDEPTETIEIGSTHLSMGIDPDVWHVVAERLAR